mmetsp:Transcript_19575/g.29011  ORF Transcript_19575/g.29011 Transcript_19575/m.29011 type:complete len:256 (-) Transcript_19575:95-862(-)
MAKTTIGVLALQGAFSEHAQSFRKLGAEVVEVRLPSDFQSIDAIVLPGGESTAIALIGERWNIFPELKKWVQEDRPIWGTCAGMILLSDRALMQKEGGQPLVGGLDVEVCRNYFGSQISSFEQKIDTSAFKLDKLAQHFESEPYSAVFIRAPAILEVGSGDIEVLSRVRASPCAQARRSIENIVSSIDKGDPKELERFKHLSSFVDASQKVLPEVIVAARKKNILATAFHPELTSDLRWHAYFMNIVSESKAKSS